MPEYDTGVDKNTKLGVWDLDNYREVRKRVIKITKECKNKHDVDGDLSIIIFGGYGRGNANKETSDLDINIFTDGVMETMVGLRLQHGTVGMDDCIEEKLKQILQFPDVDVRIDIYESPGFFLIPALEEGGFPRQVYDLIDEEKITLNNIKNMGDKLEAGKVT